MSESLRIKFERPDRTYRFGERVTGWVLIQTPRFDLCKSIRLRHFWGTHGKGNDEKGDYSLTTLHRGPLPDEGPHRLEFSFPAPAGPFTYHGRYLNVDQYVEAIADIPLARDPKAREEYVLLPGRPVTPPELLLETRQNALSDVVAPLAGFVGAALSVLGLSLLLTANPVGVLFLGGALVLFLPALKKVADRRLGEAASAYLSSLVVGPGEQVGVEVKVAPPKPVRLNLAFVELKAEETCVSGSGSNRRVHRHTVFSRRYSLAGALELEGGSVRMLRRTIQIPEGAPTSFKGRYNKLLWQAIVRLDIPSWPDWVKRIPLVVWPTKDQLGAGAEVEVLARPEEESEVPSWDVEAEVEVEETFEPAPAIEPAPVEEPEPAGGAPTLPGLVASINGAGIFGKERDLLIKDLVGRSFTLSLKVKRVDRTMGVYSDAAYRDGHTVVGVVTGSDLEVAVYFPSARNEEVKEWEEGSTQTLLVEVTDWDRLRKRPELMARG